MDIFTKITGMATNIVMGKKEFLPKTEEPTVQVNLIPKTNNANGHNLKSRQVYDSSNNPRKRSEPYERTTEVREKKTKPTTSEEEIIYLVKHPENSTPSLVTLTPTEAEIGARVMKQGGASARVCALMQDIQSIFKNAVFDAAFSYRHLKGIHRKNADTITGWAGGILAGVVSSYVPDIIIEQGFGTVVLPILRMSEGAVDPKSMEAVAINGVKSLKAKDIRHFINIVQSLDFSQAPTGFDLRLMKLKRLLTKIEKKEPMEEAGLNITPEPSRPRELLRQGGTFILKGAGILPNGQEQPFVLACLCTGNEVAIMGMIHIGRTPEKPKGDLIPALLTTDIDSIDNFITVLEKYKVIDCEDMGVFKVTFA